MKLVKLKFRTPFKVGRDDYIDAILIYRALMSVLAYMGVDPLYVINKGVKVSSVLPFIGEPLFFSPPKKVYCKDRRTDKDRRTEKAIKKANYVTKKVLENIKESGKFEITCKDNAIMLNDKIEVKLAQGVIYADEKAVQNELQKRTEEGLFNKRVDYKNRMDRISNTADIYTVASYYPTTEMAIIVENYDEVIGKGIKLLGKLGIGGERSIGYGKFEVTGVEDFNFNFTSGSYYYLTGRGFTKEGFIADRFERVTGIAGSFANVITLPLLILIPRGSLVKSPCKAVLGYDSEWKDITNKLSDSQFMSNVKNVIIIDPIVI